VTFYDFQAMLNDRQWLLIKDELGASNFGDPVRAIV
jgi:hypothetical protein